MTNILNLLNENRTLQAQNALYIDVLTQVKKNIALNNKGLAIALIDYYIEEGGKWQKQK